METPPKNGLGSEPRLRFNRKSQSSCSGALAEPEIHARLKRARLGRDMEGSEVQAWDAISEGAALPVDVPADLRHTDPEESW